MAFVLVLELWLRLTSNLPFLSRTHCFTQTSSEVPAFRPGCLETIHTPEGAVDFRVNEDGFRDRPRAYFRRGALGLLGDSFAEGFWLPEERGLARTLEAKLKLPVPILNLGIRGTGPSQQATRYLRASETYGLKGAVWLLNPSDPLDEVYFRARNPDFKLGETHPLAPLWEPTAAYWWWTRRSLSAGDRIYVLLYVAERWIKQRWQSEVVRAGEFSERVHCSSLAALADRLRARHQALVFVGMPHGLTSERRYYLGLPVRDDLFERMLSCAKATGFPVLDMRTELAGHPEWYFAHDWHFNAAGAEAVTVLIAPRISAALRSQLR